MRRILPTIVISQFFCTSLWFAGNAIIPDIIHHFHLDQGFLAHLTSAVQFGFINGTLVFAILAIADRFSPSQVFFISSILAGLFNLGMLIKGFHSGGFLLSRFLTGFFLAGIYPVGMKIASDYYQEGLGKSLGFLVGALVLGTAFPHLLRSLEANLPYEYVVYTTSILSATGGLLMLIVVPDGPFRKPARNVRLTAFFSGFRNKTFQAVAFGYFGHMWELYTFWAMVPVMLSAYKNHYSLHINVPLLSFLVIATGGIACVFGGLLSQYFGVRKIATLALLLSAICCIVSPFFLLNNSPSLFMVFLLFWSLVVIADSPLFSTLVAQNAPEESKAASLTIVNSIGFAITIISIQSIHLLSKYINMQLAYMILAIGPVLGLIALRKGKNKAFRNQPSTIL